jgi:hypothetical protein
LKKHLPNKLKVSESVIEYWDWFQQFIRVNIQLTLSVGEYENIIDDGKYYFAQNNCGVYDTHHPN